MPGRTRVLGAPSRRHRVICAVDETADVTTILLEPDDGGPRVPFEPGHLATVGISGCDPITGPLVSDPGAADHLAVTVRATDDPSRAAVSALDAGHRVVVTGPRGDPWPLERVDGWPLTVVAIGDGMSLVRSLLLVAARRPRAAPRGLVIAARERSDLPYRGDLDRWPALGYRTWVTLERPPPAWRGRMDPPEALLPEAVPPGAAVMVAGPGPLLDRIAGALDQLRTVRRAWIRSLPERPLVTMGDAPCA